MWKQKKNAFVIHMCEFNPITFMSLNVKTFLARREKLDKKYFILYCCHCNHVCNYGKNRKKKHQMSEREGGGQIGLRGPSIGE